MNNLQKLIRLRGLTVKGVAEQIGYGYHNVQKIIKGSTRPRPDGTATIRSNREIEVSVAALFGLTHDECWGSQSDQVLTRLIRQEIAAKASEAASKLRKQYL